MSANRTSACFRVILPLLADPARRALGMCASDVLMPGRKRRRSLRVKGECAAPVRHRGVPSRWSLCRQQLQAVSRPNSDLSRRNTGLGARGGKRSRRTAKLDGRRRCPFRPAQTTSLWRRVDQGNGSRNTVDGPKPMIKGELRRKRSVRYGLSSSSGVTKRLRGHDSDEAVSTENQVQ